MDTQDSAQQVPARSLGPVLAAERERQGLSRADVAQRLHMSAYQVEAIETGDYTRLPRGTFLRGFVRNYAKLLGMAPDDVVPLLEETGPHDARPGIVVPTQNIRFDPLGDRLSNPYVKAGTLAVVAIAIGFAAMYWWTFVRPTPLASVKKPGELSTSALVSAPEIVAKAAIALAPPAEAPKPAENPQSETPAVTPAPAEPPRPEAKKAEPPKAEPKKAEAPKAQPKAPAPTAEAKKPETKTVAGTPGPGTLKFRFKGESWVEIRDAKGKVLLSRLNAPGTEAEVSGNPPFNVVVGNAPDVQLFYNDHEFNLEPHTKVAVARFTVE